MNEALAGYHRYPCMTSVQQWGIIQLTQSIRSLKKKREQEQTKLCPPRCASFQAPNTPKCQMEAAANAGMLTSREVSMHLCGGGM